ncbi:hypothetical protein A3Q56_00318 [Intoshia linei]|uniref:Large ribosomal subunit protein uL22 n=1 Tax=Intoshia linei TaxID=1819745 RepID=A0A177BC69_9BILA|nr:hypothetical protein A3Q56_00318 [Intoshia linei]
MYCKQYLENMFDFENIDGLKVNINSSLSLSPRKNRVLHVFCQHSFHPNSDNRCSEAERTVTKLQKEVDRLEDDLENERKKYNSMMSEFETESDTMVRYSVLPKNQQNIVKARISNARVHFKNTRETANAISNMNLKQAMKYLNDVKEYKRCVPFRRYNGGIGKCSQAKEFKHSQGRWPQKSLKFLLDLLKNAESNAENKGLDTDRLNIKYVQVNRAATLRRRTFRAHGRINPFISHPCHIELMLEEEDAGVSKPKSKDSFDLKKNIIGVFEREETKYRILYSVFIQISTTIVILQNTLKYKMNNLTRPKRPPSSYLIFLMNFRDKMKQQKCVITNIELTKKAGLEWKELESKEIWENLAKKKKEEYEIKLDYYMKNRTEEEAAEDVQNRRRKINGNDNIKKKKKKKDPNQPKRPQSAYFLWMNGNRKDINTKFPNMGITMFSRKASEIWKQMTEDDKIKWQTAAQADRLRYNEEMKTFRLNSNNPTAQMINSCE